MIEIVKFDRPLIGYRQNNAVVYARVPLYLTDAEAKQYGYEQVKEALEYEQTQDAPSFDGSEMAAIETFIPELPKVKSLKIIGDSYVQFAENESERTLTFTVEAIDQYGEPIEREWEWSGAVDGMLNITPTDDNLTVTVSADGVAASVDVGVYPYVKPVPYIDEMAMLKAQAQANADRADFQEEVITEIIMALYG